MMSGSMRVTTRAKPYYAPDVSRVTKINNKCDRVSPKENNMNKTKMDIFIENVCKVLDEASTLLITKQEDYGSSNISRAPGGALNGLRVRMHDKIERINNIIDSGQEPNHESLRDSFIDLANYGLIALMVIDGTWPND